jgi:acyl-CoA dehydrogenase
VTAPTEARERLCHYMYWTLEPTNPFGLLQEALLMTEAVEPLEKRIRVEGVKTGRITALDLPGQIQQAVTAGIITEAEATTLREYDRKVMDLINVDDFAPHELGTQAEPAPEPVTQPAAVRTSVHVA